jgi:hypothetical protein
VLLPGGLAAPHGLVGLTAAELAAAVYRIDRIDRIVCRPAIG